MTVYERIAQAMADKDTDYVSILITDDGIDVYTSLEQDDLGCLLTEILMLQKDAATVH
jgi:hypothetical protein